MSNDKTPQNSAIEETIFAATRLTASNVNDWLASATGNRYIIIEKELIKDTLTAFDRYIDLANEINNDFNNKWHKALSMLKI